MAESTANLILLRNWHNLPLEDAMILFAYKSIVRVYVESNWKYFKFDYDCPETSAQLFDKFWDDIMPNLNDYEIVRNSRLIASELLSIPNPRTFPPPPAAKVYNFVTEKSLWEHNQEQIEERQRRIFNDPELLALKAHCLGYIGHIRAQQSRNSQASRGTPSRSSIASLPGVYLSPMPSSIGHDPSQTGEEESWMRHERSRSADGE